jgi:hypothetical protein
MSRLGFSGLVGLIASWLVASGLVITGRVGVLLVMS